MKKKILAMLMASAMALTMTACGGSASQSGSDSTADTGSDAAGGNHKISVILKTLNSGRRFPQVSIRQPMTLA